MTGTLGPQNVFMDRFVVEPKVQRVWDVPHATWFTLMGVGGGVFVIAHLLHLERALGSLFGLPLVDIVSFLAIAVGGAILIADLGQPWRFVRAVLNPRTSWISRGAIADFIFLLGGGLLILPDLRLGELRPFAALPWDASGGSAIGVALEAVTVAAGAVVMFYAGQVLAAPRAIPYWNSFAIPLQFLFSAATMAATTIVLLEVLQDRLIPSSHLMLIAVFSLGTLAAILWHLAVRRDVPGKSHSLRELLRGRYRNPFFVGVLGMGTLVPLILSLIALPAVSTRDVVGIITFATTLPAGFALRLITLRVGIFPPVVSVVPSP